MNAKELYIELQKSVYDLRPYHRLKDWGEGMEIVEEVISDYWRERFLINHQSKEAYELMNRCLTLIVLTQEEVDWKGIKTLKNNKYVLYGFIDKKFRVVVPFQAKGWEELEEQRPEADIRAKN